MIHYKLRHIPTGLYFKPHRQRFQPQKNNLTAKGSTYTKMPQWKWVEGIFIDGKYVKTVPEDWEIVQLEMVESKRLKFLEAPYKN